MIKSKRAFTIVECAEYVGVSPGTVRNWIVSGILPFEELPGRGNGAHKHRLIRKSDLDVFLDAYYRNGGNSINNMMDSLIRLQ